MFFLIAIIFASLMFEVFLFKLSWNLFKITFPILVIIFVIIICGCVDVQAYEYNPYDIVLIGKVAQHEAGNQSELGKRLVIDTILNRVESEEFPNSVTEVLSQPGQYCNPSKYPPDDMYQLVAEEIFFRTNNQVLWYRTKKYHSYGSPVLKEGDHYFSGKGI